MDAKVIISNKIGKYPYVIIQHSMGHLCGYVGIPRDQNHLLYGIRYNKCIWECSYYTSDISSCLHSGNKPHQSQEMLLKVHGGITYSEEGQGDYLPIGYWWFGFDAAHCDDYVPGLYNVNPSAVYRDREYMEKNCILLINQLKDME